MKRYLDSLNNLILTDYLEFRWYVDGEKRLTAKLATIDTKGNLKKVTDGNEAFTGLFNEFLKIRVPTIGTPRELANRMANLAQMIRDIIEEALAREDEKGIFQFQLEGFREVLLHSLTPKEFADMYAQTICYGLFTARYNYSDKDPFTRQKAAFILPKTNPFLRKLFSQMAGPEMDDRIDWAVDNLAELLNRADIGAILKGFGKRTKREDPVVHFYETFLSEYDSKLRKVRGVYYTPEPVVSYIVRSIDHILKKDFDLKDGLADKTKIKYTKKPDDTIDECHKVLILDPAVGTGTFLFNVIDHIHEYIVGKGQGGTWSEYVSEHLLPRLFGFELLVAPYAVAHMKLDIQLKETNFDFKTDERVKIFLTNSLEEAFPIKGLPIFAKFIAEEANEAGKIKQDLPVMVVLGNPPYAGHSENKGEWIKALLHGKDERTNTTTENYFECNGEIIKEKQIKWLNDDYAKFIRFAHHRIEQTGYGILAFISNHGYLDNPTFRGMRESLLNTFDEIYILNLHGNKKKKEKCPDGSDDENVFDIRQGVAIGIFVKKKKENAIEKQINYKDLWGLRVIREKETIIGGKYFWLSENSVINTKWANLNPQKPYYLFTPQDHAIMEEYNLYVKIDFIMKTHNVGFVTARDRFAIDFDREKLISRISTFRKSDEMTTSDALKLMYDLKNTSSWNIDKSRLGLRNKKDWKKELAVCIYRPLDFRWVYYSNLILERPVYGTMQHMLPGNNIGLISARSNKSQVADHFFCTKFIMEAKCGESTTQSSLFPLYIYPEKGKLDLDEPSDAPGGRRPNLDKKFVKELSEKIKLEFISDGTGDLKKTFGPEDIFNYIYAVFHSPAYRKRYAEFLKIDFPRLPLTSKLPLFRKLCALGDELVRLHLMENELDLITKYPIDGDHTVDKVRYSAENSKGEIATPSSRNAGFRARNDVVGKVWINDKQYFDSVPSDVWEFQIGGYQVCHKWLKDRKGRKLTIDDLYHYQYIVAALSLTIKLMADIDTVIDKNGGWPIK